MITVIPRDSSSSANSASVARAGRVEHADLGHPDDHHGDLRAVRIVIVGDGLRDAFGRTEEHRPVQPQQRDPVVTGLRRADGSSRTTLLRRATVRSAKERREHADLHRLDQGRSTPSPAPSART